MTAIPELLRQLISAGLTQCEIQRRTGIPQSRISRWAAGAVPTGAHDALKLQALYLQLNTPQSGSGTPNVGSAAQQITRDCSSEAKPGSIAGP